MEMTISQTNTSYMQSVGYVKASSVEETIDVSKDFSVEKSELPSDASDIPCSGFEQLCRDYPDIAFVIADPRPTSEEGTDFSKPYEYAGICDTTNFGNLSKKSIMLPEKMLNLLNDPDSKRKLYECINQACSEYRITSGSASDGGSMWMELSNEDGKLKYSVVRDTASQAKFYSDYSGGKTGEKLDIHAMLLRKSNLYAEKKYNEMIDSLYGDKTK